MSTITLNINDCGSPFVYTACADFGFSFESIGAESEFLNVGNLISESGIIGDYFIEWRLNAIDGALVFNSGNSGNTDIELDGYHPLINETVTFGDLYPVLKYVYVDGNKYTLTEEEGSRYSPDLLNCLTPPPISVVEAIDESMDANCAGYAKFVDDGGYASSASTSSLNIPYPSTTTSGNLLILSVASKSGATINTPAGWTAMSAPINGGGSPTINSGQFYKISNGTEGGTNRSVTFGSSSNVCGIICQYMDFDSGNIFASEFTSLVENLFADPGYGTDSNEGCVVLGTIQLHTKAMAVTITGDYIEVGANYVDSTNGWTIIETHSYNYHFPSSNSNWGINQIHDFSYLVYQLNPVAGD